MVTVAIISDTHAYLDKRIERLIEQCDYAIHAGDICGTHILDKMKPKKGKVMAVAGNNDPSCHQGELPDNLSFDLPGGVISVEHGHIHGMLSPCHDSLRKAYSNSRIIVYGHTHKMIVDKSAIPWVVNPGAAGQTRTHGGPRCLILSASDLSWDIEEYHFHDDV